jgi:hypothetical protein
MRLEMGPERACALGAVPMPRSVATGCFTEAETRVVESPASRSGGSGLATKSYAVCVAVERGSR